MKILSEEIISSTDISKNYRICRDNAKKNGKVIIFKNNAPDMVLVDFKEYEIMMNIVNNLEMIEVKKLISDRVDDAEMVISIADLKKTVKE